MRKIVGAAMLVAGLAGCQSSGTGPTWVRTASATADVDQALAYCEIMADDRRRGFLAIGSGNFVAGAAIGNAIGNAVRRQQFMRRCMTLQGYSYL